MDVSTKGTSDLRHNWFHAISRWTWKRKLNSWTLVTHNYKLCNWGEKRVLVSRISHCNTITSYSCHRTIRVDWSLGKCVFIICNGEHSTEEEPYCQVFGKVTVLIVLLCSIVRLTHNVAWGFYGTNKNATSWPYVNWLGNAYIPVCRFRLT